MSTEEFIGESHENESLARAFAQIQELGPELGVSFELKEFHRGPGVLRIESDDYGRRSDPKMFDRIASILRAQNLELGEYRGGGNHSDAFAIYEREVGGRINWRRWIPYPEKFSEEAINLLDKLAEFTELHERIDNVSSDRYGKFFTFLRIGAREGLITPQEDSKISNEMHKVC